MCQAVSTRCEARAQSTRPGTTLHGHSVSSDVSGLGTFISLDYLLFLSTDCVLFLNERFPHLSFSYLSQHHQKPLQYINECFMKLLYFFSD